MNSEQLNLTYQLDNFFGIGQWENQLKDILFRSMYENALNDDITDNKETEFINSIHWIINNLIQDRKDIEKLGNLEVITPSKLQVNMLLGKYNDNPLRNGSK